MSRVVPHAGSCCAYASTALGTMPGLLAGWLAMLDYLLIPRSRISFPAFHFTRSSLRCRSGPSPSAHSAITTASQPVGVRVAARVGTVVLVVEIVVLVVFVAVAASSVATTGPTRPWLSPLTGLGPFALAPIIGAVSVAVLSFLGFDAIASFAEESAGSERDVGRAILLCLAAAGTVFILQTWLAALISPVNPGELASRPERQGTAFYDITRAALGPWLAIVLSDYQGGGPRLRGHDRAGGSRAAAIRHGP